MNKTHKISLVGAGNVATHLGKAFKKHGFEIHQVYSRSQKNADSLARVVDAHQAINTFEALDDQCEILLVAVKDDAIANVLSKIPFDNVVIAHTSGSVPLNVFEEFSFEKYGIFYPLQTFSKTKKVTMDTVPFCLEANSSSTLSFLTSLARKISQNVYHINSQERETLHLAAVFANNFTNYMYQISKDILNENGLSFDILKPLILETASKIQEISPLQAQTGPAKRHDKKTINKHLEKLKSHPDWQKIYQEISLLIIQSSKNN